MRQSFSPGKMYRSVVENLRLDFFMQANNIRSDLLNIVCIKCYLRIHCKFGNFRETFIFARLLFSRIALKHVFATLKIRDKGVIYLYQ